MRDIPKPFEIYRHFKGNCYQILTMAQDAGDGRRLVVYQALYGDYLVYVRELEEFLSLTDTKKYPEAAQRYRFEKVTDRAKETRTISPEPVSSVKAEPEPEPEPEPVSNPDLDPAVLEFLEADTYEQRLNILASVKHRITDDMLNTMSIAADVEVEPGPVNERYSSLKNALLMKDKFERVRLR